MTYKTSDIIKRAKQLADLENSDFISYEENLMLINECYNKLYEKLINHNDKAFIKTVNLTGGYANGGKSVYELPSDFWQLYGVRVTESNVPLPRKAQSESDTKPSYDIEGNELIIYGHRLGALVMDYWTRPPELTYPRNPTRLDVTGILACYGERCIIREGGSDKLCDIYGNVIHDFELTATRWVVGKNAVAYTSRGSTVVWQNGIERTIAGGNVWVNHGIIYVADNVGAVYTQNNVKAYDGRFSYTPLLIARDFALELDAYMHVQIEYFADGASAGMVKSDIGISIPYSIVWEGNNIYFVDNNGNISCYDLEVQDLYTINDDFDAVCLAWQGEKSGYGYINTSGALCSFYPDTLLDFTHNFYFTLLAYYLAIAYKAKQNADSTALSAMAAEAEEHFYDTIGRDAYNVTRIRNHYA